MKMFGISRVVLHTIEIDFRICFRICSQLSLTKSFCVENRVFMQHCIQIQMKKLLRAEEIKEAIGFHQ